MTPTTHFKLHQSNACDMSLTDIILLNPHTTKALRLSSYSSCSGKKRSSETLPGPPADMVPQRPSLESWCAAECATTPPVVPGLLSPSPVSGRVLHMPRIPFSKDGPCVPSFARVCLCVRVGVPPSMSPHLGLVHIDPGGLL